MSREILTPPVPPTVERTADEETIESSSASEPRTVFNPPIDIYDTSDGLVLCADLPGVSIESLELQVEDNKLSLFGRVHWDVPQDARQMHSEYEVGDFLRSFILSGEIDHERISASMTNGVLRVVLPRSARSEPRRIQVKSD